MCKPAEKDNLSCRVSEIGHTVATSLALGGTKAIRSAYEPFGGQPSADVSTSYERGPPHLYKSRFYRYCLSWLVYGNHPRYGDVGSFSYTTVK